ncbi:DUF4215 domain-containing protein [Nannocystis sp. ILAH1]|uniref:DUF4215 domain-containing protein n=1 Tax=unclassified Nannocystis TaxID=2627009 RepID=UPI00226DA610|nr:MULTISPECIES: DUF4215 domain-containing protein [unclassified Nannocystis]MCY0990752.1 DUF4215 domain-containing protein [Nannocystis sp. ILAH1]MCY1072284.1 DUF4215 domain-containing protein [Nannocystis sp. RBIL2]
MRRARLGALLIGAAAAGGCAKGSALDTGGTVSETSGPTSTTTTEATTTEATATTTTTGTSTTAEDPSTTDATDATGSQNTTEGPKCGDGQLDPGELCDDGNVLNNDACTNSCKFAACGDGFVLAGTEECDDGNPIDGDDCTNMCTGATCGDGVVHVGLEACDDGNPDDADACTSQCALAGCGDGIVMMGVEECDDANAENTDACTASCKNAVCGDGILWIGTEECEDGNQIAGDGCEPDCKKTVINKYTAFGPQQNVQGASLVGWEVCYVDQFGHAGTSVAQILQQCGKANLMLACRPSGSGTYSLLAHAARAQVTADTGQSNTPTNANGTGWYFSDAFSWGFAVEGDPISRNSCDTGAVNPERRLCFHTGGGQINGGFRCGSTDFLNSSADWERVVLHAD